MERNFISLRTENIHDSNLTELNATDSVNNGFMDHADWLAHVMRYAVVMKYMKRRRDPETSILDVGCGNFPLLTYLWRNRALLQGMQYTGMDLRAKKKWLDGRLPDSTDITLIQMDVIEDNPVIKPHKYVVCTEMLEHIDKKYAPLLLKKLRAWTADDGLMFLSSPNLGGSDTVADNHRDAEGRPREWTYQGKVRLIEDAGFEIVQSIGTFIRLDNIPNDFFNQYTLDIKEKLPNAFFRVFAASAFPEMSNNAVFVCKPI